MPNLLDIIASKINGYPPAFLEKIRKDELDCIQILNYNGKKTYLSGNRRVKVKVVGYDSFIPFRVCENTLLQKLEWDITFRNCSERLGADSAAILSFDKIDGVALYRPIKVLN